VFETQPFDQQCFMPEVSSGTAKTCRLAAGLCLATMVGSQAMGQDVERVRNGRFDFYVSLAGRRTPRA
jgi:hypothetical protein